MNTAPQAPLSQDLDAPAAAPTEAGFSVSGPSRAAAARRLHLVTDFGAFVDVRTASPESVAAAAERTERQQPYSLRGRRHLAAIAPQAAAPKAEDPIKPPKSVAQRIEPLAFALVLLVSVAALVLALRGA